MMVLSTSLISDIAWAVPRREWPTQVYVGPVLAVMIRLVWGIASGDDNWVAPDITIREEEGIPKGEVRMCGKEGTVYCILSNIDEWQRVPEEDTDG